MSINEKVRVTGGAYIGTRTQDSRSTGYVLGLNIYVDAGAPGKAGEASIETPISREFYESLRSQLENSDAQEAHIGVKGDLELIIRAITLN